MPYILFYADRTDFRMIHRHLNDHPDVAFIVPNGVHRWRAQLTVPKLRGGSMALWHVTSGPLPLLHSPPSNKTGRIHDPFRGWRELFPGADRNCPYFGPGHPGIIWLNRRLRSTTVANAVGMSSFDWIGGHYARVGSPAPDATKKLWKGLRDWIKQSAILIPRKGRLNGARREIWAFPSALASFKRGQAREDDWF